MPYANAPANAWAGWRYRIQGGPIGGQYHGFIAPDETEDYAGWPHGPREMIRPMDDPRGLGTYPWEDWDKQVFGGTPLMEGDTLSDHVYRSPAEMRPRPNASGGVNTVRAVQLERTAGFAVAPGNYKTLGATPRYLGPPLNIHPFPIVSSGSQGSPVHQVCPAWGCGTPPWMTGPIPVDHTVPLPLCPVTDPTGLNQACLSEVGSPCPPCTPRAGVVAQPPPPTGPQPGPTVPIGPPGSDGCAQGQYRDAAGNCTADWHNPYTMYLPLDNPPGPAPTISANTCPTGYVQDPYGNCLASCPAGTAPDAQNNCQPTTTGAGISSWLGQTTPLFGYNVPNWGIAAVVGLIAMRGMSGGGSRRR
jgi:hypothetical protein